MCKDSCTNSDIVQEKTVKNPLRNEKIWLPPFDKTINYNINIVSQITSKGGTNLQFFHLV